MLAIIYLTILFEGIVSIAVEILTIRQLVPFVGSSIVVTSLVIGIFLLFLAAGYHRGSNVQSNHAEKLRRNFSTASIWLGLGLSYWLIFNFFHYFSSSYQLHPFAILIIYLLAITAPTIYILGQTIPITLNLLKPDQHSGHLVGRTLALSTMGSFFGATLTTLLMIHYLGVAWTIVINFTLLISLALFLSYQLKKFANQCLLSVIGLLLVITANVGVERTLFARSNNYANYQIEKIEFNETKRLIINNSRSSQLNANKQGFPYVEKIKRILFAQLALQNKAILVIGAGGFTLSAQGEKGNHFTYLDIDKQLPDVVTPDFIETISGKFIAASARDYLNRHPNEKYDVIISDAYNNTKMIPSQLLSKEYFQAIKDKLSSDGIAIFNIIANPFLSDNYSKRIDNTLRFVFSNCMAEPLQYHQAVTNILYLCPQDSNSNAGEIYTDNLNNAEWDYFSFSQ